MRISSLKKNWLISKQGLWNCGIVQLEGTLEIYIPGTEAQIFTQTSSQYLF